MAERRCLKMTTEKAIYQLTDLIKDRESFCHRDDFDDMFLQDIEAYDSMKRGACKLSIKRGVRKNSHS